MSDETELNHIASLEIFRTDVNKVIQGAYPSGTQPCAVRRHDLKSGLSVGEAEKDAVDAGSRFADDHDQRNTMLMVVYNGHAYGGGYECFLSGTRGSDVSINWSYVSRALNTTRHAEVLLVMDCCYTSAAAIHARVEILAATDKDGEAALSLTRTLADTLMSSAGKRITVSHIHGLMLRDANENNPSPVHIALGKKLHGRSIVLARLGEVHAIGFLPREKTLLVTVTAKLPDIFFRRPPSGRRFSRTPSRATSSGYVVSTPEPSTPQTA